MTSVTFNGVELVTSEYAPRFVKHESVADRVLMLTPRARADGSVLVAERFGEKRITVRGTLSAVSAEALETAIDTLNLTLAEPEAELIIDWAGDSRVYIATCSKLEYDRDHYNINFVPWTAEFVVPTGEGKDSSTTQPAGADGDTVTFNPSGGPYGTTSFTIEGSKPPRPVVELGASFGSLVRGVEYKNTDTGERLVITYTGSWGNSRTITLDFEARTVVGTVVDGVSKALNFFGVFPRFLVGTNNWQITAGGIVNQKSADDEIGDLASSQVAATNASYYKAQSFKVPYTDETFQGIMLAIYKTGAPDNMTWRIETDSGDKPSGTLAHANATGTIGAGDAGTSMAYVTDYAANPFTLEANTTYWLVLRPGASSGSNFWTWGMAGLGSDGDASYPRGRAVYTLDSGGTWQEYTNKSDMSFRILYGGQQATVAFTHAVTYTRTYR